MKRVVSVSLGSSKRDKTSRATILEQEFEISRVGTDGDIKRFARMIQELDGKVDAIGLGGCDRYLWVDNRRYAFREIDAIAKLAKTTPVVDGSGVKNTLERRTIEFLQSTGLVDFTDKRVLVVCATDRFGMAQSLAKLAKEVVFGDLMFNVGVPVPMRSYGAVRLAATTLLPIVTKVPFQWLYPTGEKQDTTQPKYQKYYKWADVIAGDFLIIKKTMPTVESGLLEHKVVITNTVTAEDTQAMMDRKVRMLITSTPQYDGRYYATNVYEGVLITLMGKRPENVTPKDYEDLLAKLKWRPTITDLTQLRNAE
jgi:hypothetical protein